MALTPITNGASIVTGPQSRMSCTLPDGTVFTVGANSNMVIDEFVYDPDSYSSVRTIRARVELGVFRWVTGKTSRKDPANMKVTLPAGYTGIRGTDLEVLVTSDKSASLRLYTGEVDYTDKRTGATVVLTAGYSLRIASDGSFGKPVRLPPAPKPAPSGR